VPINLTSKRLQVGYHTAYDLPITQHPKSGRHTRLVALFSLPNTLVAHDTTAGDITTGASIH
jgi:hypothetical protein